MAKENTNLDSLLAAAEQKIKQKEEERSEIFVLIGNLDIRWRSIFSHPVFWMNSFISELKTEEPPIEALGFSPELMNPPLTEDEEFEKMKSDYSVLVRCISEKKAEVDRILNNNFLSDKEQEEIKNVWELSLEEFEKEKTEIDNSFSSKGKERSEKEQNYKQALKDQKTFINKYRGYHPVLKVDGIYLFDKLVTNGEDSEWFYNNLLTEKEKTLIDDLRSKNEKEEWGSENKENLFKTAQHILPEFIRNKIDDRLEDTFGVKESLEELLSVEKKDKAVFDAAKKKIIETLGEAVWGDLEKRAKAQVEESKGDIDAWKTNKKGFGKNTSENRKKRLIEMVEPLRKEKQEIYNTSLDQLNKIGSFLYELLHSSDSIEDNQKELYDIHYFDEVPEDVRQFAEHIYNLFPLKLIYQEIRCLKYVAFLDADPDNEITQKLEKLSLSLQNNRILAIRDLEKIVIEREKDLNRMSAKISQELNKFPDTPDDYYPLDIAEGIKKRRS